MKKHHKQIIMKTNRDHPAFFKNTAADYKDGRMSNTYTTNGLTKREYAAIHIMAELMSSDGLLHSNMDAYAVHSRMAADALFNELEK